jgi:hypothetical protein
VDRQLNALLLAGLVGAAGCGSQQPAADVPSQTAPLPTAGIAAQKVAVYPLTLLAVDESLGWADLIGARRDALDRADSVIAEFLLSRAPEVTWVLPAELARAAKRAPGLLTDPHQMGTALLRAPNLQQVPDPLRSQMRTLTGMAGERYALVPASLVYLPAAAGAEAELSLVMVDVRTGRIGWRTVARGKGTEPWDALWNGLKLLVPGLP